MLVKRNYIYVLLYSAGWGWGKGGISEQLPQGGNSAAFGGVSSAGSMNPNAGSLGWEMPSPSGEGVPVVHKARGDSSQIRLNLGAGSLNAVAHIRLHYLVSEAAKVGGSAQEDLAGPWRD